MPVSSFSTSDLDLIDGADLAYCKSCDQLTLQTVDQVLNVYAEGAVSEVIQRCLSCEHTQVVHLSA